MSVLLAFVGSYAYWRETNNVIHFKLYSQNHNNLRDKRAYLLIIRRQIPTKASNGNVELKTIINISRLVLHLQVICIILRWWNYLTSNRESNTPKREWSIKAKAIVYSALRLHNYPAAIHIDQHTAWGHIHAMLPCDADHHMYLSRFTGQLKKTCSFFHSRNQILTDLTLELIRSYRHKIHFQELSQSNFYR